MIPKIIIAADTYEKMALQMKPYRNYKIAASLETFTPDG
jgi:hypothetical protein